MSYLDNGEVRVGVDLGHGGAITYLSQSGSTANLINSYDCGRQIQMSHYSGPVPFVKGDKVPTPHWAGLGWNPIQTGDAFGNRSQVIEHRNDGQVLYVKCIPLQWPMDNVPGECTFEWWITLEANTVRIRSRLVNDRPDRTQYAARDQELPAIYTNGPWYRLVTYLGDRPFEDAPVTVLNEKGGALGFPWLRFSTPERWAALLDEHDWGLGIYHPEALHFAGGFAGGESQKGTGAAADAPTGYVSPILSEILDHNLVYDNRFVLVLGTLEQIRSFAMGQPRPEKLPAFCFDQQRQHWWLENATDGGYPVPGELRIVTTGVNSALRSPPMFWQAGDAPTLFVEAAFGAGASEAAVAFAPFGPDDVRGWEQWGPHTRPPFGWPQVVRFPVIGDETMRVYTVPLHEHADYRGAMLGLRLQLPESQSPCRIRSIGLRPPRDL